MEAGTRTTTQSRTIADLVPRAARVFADRVALKHKADGTWHDVTYAEMGEIVTEIALGLIDLGIEPGDRVCILGGTRAEWAYADFAATTAGATVVPIYPTNSAEECAWVAGDSGAVAVIAEDGAQLAKIEQVRGDLPALRHLIVFEAGEGTGDAVTLDELRARGAARDRAELEARYDAITAEDPYTYIYTSGTTGPPKGCVLTHGNYRSVMDMVAQRDLFESDDDLVYLFLPLAHAFALLVQLATVDRGVAIAYFGGDSKQILPEIMEVRPTYLPSVPRIFEKLYTMAQGQLSPEEIETIRTVGGQIMDLEVHDEEVPAELREQFAPLEPKVAFVKGLFGGRVREAVTGAAPIAREILEFFWGCGVPVLEGYGMTETSTTATVSSPENHRFGTVGRALPGVEIRIADDGEILIKGPNIFGGYHNNADASFGAVEDGWLHTGDLGSLDEDGYLSITGRKKDIIITAGGKNLTPANFENDLKQSRWVSQCVMHGDRRPFPVALITLDEEEVVPWAAEHGIEDTSPAALAVDPQVRGLIQAEVDRANARLAQVEQVKKFVILDHDLSQETGELTPTLKVKRNVVNEKYAGLFDELYS
jgi:long-chain acyl-CoA synthetase